MQTTQTLPTDSESSLHHTRLREAVNSAGILPPGMNSVALNNAAQAFHSKYAPVEKRSQLKFAIFKIKQAQNANLKMAYLSLDLLEGFSWLSSDIECKN